jgi:hypothetical protein
MCLCHTYSYIVTELVRVTCGHPECCHPGPQPRCKLAHWSDQVHIGRVTFPKMLCHEPAEAGHKHDLWSQGAVGFDYNISAVPSGHPPPHQHPHCHNPMGPAPYSPCLGLERKPLCCMVTCHMPGMHRPLQRVQHSFLTLEVLPIPLISQNPEQGSGSAPYVPSTTTLLVLPCPSLSVVTHHWMIVSTALSPGCRLPGKGFAGTCLLGATTLQPASPNADDICTAMRCVAVMLQVSRSIQSSEASDCIEQHANM